MLVVNNQSMSYARSCFVHFVALVPFTSGRTKECCAHYILKKRLTLFTFSGVYMLMLRCVKRQACISWTPVNLGIR